MTTQDLERFEAAIGELHRGLAVSMAIELLGLVALVAVGAPRLLVVLLSAAFVVTFIGGAIRHVALARKAHEFMLARWEDERKGGSEPP